MIVDSGERRQFESGAVRDIQEGKGRCDLLPLDVIAEFICATDEEKVMRNILTDDEVIMEINNFMATGSIRHIYMAVNAFIHRFGGDRMTVILEVAKHFEEGAIKYDERNWEKGIPCHCFVDSGLRHYIKCLRGDTDERHDRAFIWNMFCLIWTLKHNPKMIDLPFNKTNAEPDYDKAEALKYTE